MAEAARKAREQKKALPKPAKVFTNDNLPSVSGAVNVVGSAPPAAAPEAVGDKPAATEEQVAKEKEKETKGEAAWRKRFAEARGRLRTGEKELDIMQRELNLQQQQYYSDPNKALRQQYSRSDINNLTKAIADKKQEVAQLKQALSDLEDELRRAGGDPGWARE
ncbi:MAG: hypothetical protein HY237_01805 [Acidobacteria bacterium]|nr:hypothetical protein [Acidobacteriota bacterium]